MASEPLGGGGGDSREKQKWAESGKVYKRKNHNKGIKINNESSIINNNVAQQSSQTLATTTEDANSLQPQALSRFDAASDDSSSHTPPVENGRENMNGNGVKPEDPNVEKIRFRSISMRSKVEKRDLRRKLLGELDQVRSLAKKLDTNDGQLSGYAHSQVSGNDGLDRGGGALRVNSEVGSVGVQDSRPFRGLSVSVMGNSHGIGEFVEKEKRTPKANKYYQNPDFVLGKDKFPPPESNKKPKSNGVGIDKYVAQAFKNCGNLLAKLMLHKHGWVFNNPVDVKGLGLHDYYSIIKQPMDFGTVKSRLSKNWYKSPKEFAEDVRLTLQNAMTYNPKGQDVHCMAEQLLKIFEEKWAAIEADRYWRFGMGHDAGTPTPTSRKAPYLHHHHSPEMRTVDRSGSMAMPIDSNLKPGNFAHMRMPVPKKPKAKDPHKRDMTYEEKQKLSSNLQSLPSEKLDHIVQIIKKRNSAVSQQDDEIEVDIDSVDAETLWELDRYVTNYKKSLSKNKRKAELAFQARANSDHNIREMYSSSATARAPKGTKSDGEHVSASPIQAEKQGDNAGGGSSSSSSSSDSGSSSSDSDSESSSAYGSDAGHSPKN
ncbi:transcription factor GTE4-like isoform X2 [Vitis riparia]|uniref:transcription factor GTE4-like isoform X2 n=1 Tax=Vitis riparia TaxID=96939 RepID=UPI00155ABF78|nr:transcription factor GTE4-like isoform X2 [Vitis riparia]